MKPMLCVLAVSLGTLLVADAVAQSGQSSWHWGSYWFDHNNTPGWALMSAQERGEFRQKMKNVKTYDEYVDVQEEYKKKMEERAKERKTMLRALRANACDRLKAKGSK